MYPSEINNQRMRNTGNAVAMITNWVFVYVIVLITPIGKIAIQHLHACTLRLTIHRSNC